MQKLLTDGLDFGARLKQLRTSKGFSQYDIERELSLRGRIMTRARYAHIEQGLGNLYISDLILLKEILGVEYHEFFDGLTPSYSYSSDSD